MRKTIAVSQFYRTTPAGEVFLLASVDKNKVALISLLFGNRWTGMVYVKDVNDITDGEWERISKTAQWKRVKLTYTGVDS